MSANAICIFGGTQPVGPDGERIAYDTGAALARLGYTVVNGGYGGTMEASARGAVEAGGHTVGVTCGIWDRRPNPHMREIVETDCYAERLHRLIGLGEAGFVALPGATGTLGEVALVWEDLAKGRAERVVPLVLMGEFWRPLVEMMAEAKPGIEQAVTVLDSPVELGNVFARLRA